MTVCIYIYLINAMILYSSSFIIKTCECSCLKQTQYNDNDNTFLDITISFVSSLTSVGTASILDPRQAQPRTVRLTFPTTRMEIFQLLTATTICQVPTVQSIATELGGTKIADIPP